MTRGETPGVAVRAGPEGACACAGGGRRHQGVSQQKAPGVASSRNWAGSDNTDIDTDTDTVTRSATVTRLPQSCTIHTLACPQTTSRHAPLHLASAEPPRHAPALSVFTCSAQAMVPVGCMKPDCCVEAPVAVPDRSEVAMAPVGCK